MVSTPWFQSLRSLLGRLRRHTASTPPDREQALRQLLQTRARKAQRQAWQFRVVLLLLGLVVVPLLLPHAATSGSRSRVTQGAAAPTPSVAAVPAGPPAGD